MNEYQIENTIRNFSTYIELENIEDPCYKDAVSLLLASQQIIKHPVDQTIYKLFTESDWLWEVERLSVFNGFEPVYETLDKFINIFEQYYAGYQPMLKRVDNLFITEGLFDGFNVYEEAEQKQLIELLLSGQDLVLIEDENEGEG